MVKKINTHKRVTVVKSRLEWILTTAYDNSRNWNCGYVPSTLANTPEKMLKDADVAYTEVTSR